MRKIAKIAGEVICVISLIVILAASAMFLTGSKPAVVKSGSMEPTIRTGSLIIISSKGSKPEADDIVAFEKNGSIVVHRLVKKTDEGWVTRGDANESDDPWRVSEADIRGEAVLWIPAIGYLIGRGE